MKVACCPICEGSGEINSDLTGHLVYGTHLGPCWGCQGHGFIDCKTAFGIELSEEERIEVLLGSYKTAELC